MCAERGIGMMDLVQASFDYEALDQETRVVVQARTSEIKALVKRAAQDIIDIGQKLVEVKDRLDFGQFQDWLGSEFGWSASTARRFMRVAEKFQNVQIERFGSSALYLLSADNTPEPARDEAIERAEAGERITYSTAQDIVEFHKDVHTMCPVCSTVYSTSYLACPECTYKAGGALRADDGTGTVQSYPHPDVRTVEKRPVSYHVSDDSYDWYTPAEYIEAAREVMGGIDLDPATSEEAQVTVRAGEYYTKHHNGLEHPWVGRVWLNPPYNVPLIGQFVDKVVGEYEAGQVESAIVLTNNSTDTAWFHKLLAYPVCLTRGRIRFWSGEETLATRQGQALFYLGHNKDSFAKVFSQFGEVMGRYDEFTR